MQELDHQAGEALERARDADGRADFDQYTLGGVDVDLQFARFVDGRIQKREKALSCRQKERG
jgi:hypothetical protein